MKVAITGATGFVGSHTVAAVQAAGHDVVAVVRSPEKVARNLAPAGADPTKVEVAVADVTDEAAVRGALDGCDAVIHAASVFSLDPRKTDEMAATNQRGIETVLGTASTLKLDPIVHVSSIVALLRAGVVDDVLDEDSPVGNPPGPYSATKAAQEAYVRQLQADGAPIVITYPGSVWGPHDPYNGESVQAAKAAIKGLYTFAPDGGVPIVDVRDVARVHAAVLEPGQGPRRYMVGGNDAPVSQLVPLIGDAIGKTRPQITVPAAPVLLLGKVADWLRTKTGMNPGMSHEVVWNAVRRVHADNTRIAEEFGVNLRPLEETVTDQVRWMQEAGRI